jgi:holliday junction DNA helicase RuvA
VIEFVKGIVDYVSPEYVVVDVSGVGYQVYSPNPFVYQHKLGSEEKIYTYHHVREDTSALYGFQNREEKALFVKLLNVSGIGPKGALAILATGEPSHVVQAIEEEDEKYLVQFPGVGKKTARQIILDLKGKLNDLPGFMPDLFNQDVNEKRKSTSTPELEEAIEALHVLGYAEREIKKVLPQLQQQQLSTDGYVKAALQLLLKSSKR